MSHFPSMAKHRAGVRLQHTWQIRMLSFCLVLSLLASPLAAVAEPTAGDASAPTATDLMTALVVNFYNHLFAATPAAAQTAAPGGVSTNLRAWHRADDGTAATGTTWGDFSSNGEDAAPVNNPVFTANAINFNPAFDFNNTNQYFNYPSHLDLIGTNSFSIFAAALPDQTGTASAHEPIVGMEAGSTLGANFTFFNGKILSHISGSAFLRYGPNTAPGEPVIASSIRTDTTNWATYKNGTRGILTPGSSLSGGSGDNMTIGKLDNVHYYDGRIAEVIVYNTNLSNAEQQKIRAYLAIKYGTTLSSDTDGDGIPFQDAGTSGDGVNEGDYLASDDTVIWDAGANQTYHNDIAGIGRDDTSVLSQKQSKSVNGNALVTIGHGDIAANNASNSNDFSANMSFLFWGHNNGSTSFTTSVGNTMLKRMARIWKTAETGAVGTVKVRLPQAAFNSTSPTLLRSTDPTFDGGDTQVALTDDGNGNYAVTIDFNNGDYFTFAQVPPQTATVDKRFSVDGSTFTDDVSVEQYRTVTARLYYNNTSSTAGTGATISATIPTGFVLVPGSTRNCLNPTPGETVCNSSSGQGGPIHEAAVWNGQTLNIAPTAGLFGEPVSATSGRLEVGRKRYINIHECQYFQASINDDFTTIAVPGGSFATGTNASNTANSSPVCGSGGSGGHNLQSAHVRAFDTLGRRYFNFHECQYLEQPGTPDNIFVSAIQGLSGTNTSNTPNSSASCGTAWGNHPYWSSNIRVLDTRNKRYFNISECQYYNSSTGEDFFTNLWSAPNTGYSTTAMTTAGCSNASGFTLQGFNHLALDTYDTTRGTGFIEFKLRANADPNAYPQTAIIEGNEFATQTDSGTITVLPPPPVVVDKKFSTNGVTFVDDITILQDTTLTERLYYNNTDSVVGTGSTINTTIPAGFTRVPNSTKVCLELTPGEVVCNTSPGMGGPIDESAVWSGQTLNIAPTAGLYGQPVNATSGRLEVGRKRYLNEHECQYYNSYQATGEDFFVNIGGPGGPGSNFLSTGTNVSNSADPRPNCYSGTWGGHILWRQWVRPLDLLGRRYLNLHECQYFNRSDADDFFAIIPNAGTKTSNSVDGSPNCNNFNWGGHILWRQWVQNLDSLGNRYLNQHECQYFNQNDADDFFTSGPSTGVHFSNSPDTIPSCSQGPWGGHILWRQWVLPLDLLDTARGTGFIEFKVVANAAVGTYAQDVTGSGNEFSDYTDTGTITVRTLVDDDGDGIPNWVEGDGFVDTDGDTIPDSQDTDSDNDGIPDAVERGDNPNSPRNTDGDDVADYRDLDSDNDGINDVVEAGGLTDANNDGMADGTDGNGDGMIDSPQTTPVDSDGDTIPDYRDLDSDNDTISDLLEGGSGATDADNNGVADGYDTDGDGIVDTADDLSGFGDAAGPALPDKDSGSDDDSTPDYLDRDDDDNGGALDIDAAGNGNLDTNDDGMLDANDMSPAGTGGTDADGDGVDDLVDEKPAVFGGLNNDTDGDDIPNTLDADDDNDGIPDTVETANAPANGDSDGDGVPDALDLDSDNDGINDVVEAGGADADGDGQIDDAATNQGTLTNPTNSDDDSQPNYVDLDSDNDTLSDLREGGSLGSDTDDDGMVDGPDTDGDGIQDSVDGLSGFGDAEVATLLPDKDHGSDDDNAPDYADADDDITGFNDIALTVRAGLDTNGDGMVDSNDTNGGSDVDNDGIDDLVDQDTGNFGGLPAPAYIDSDNDSLPDLTDPDDDNDGLLDINETGDTDNDGIPDRIESNIQDTDGDGNFDFNDDNADGEGAVDGTNGEQDGVETGLWNDTDNDGIPDHLDAANGDGSGPTIAGSGDSDGDGIPDGVECPNGYICDDTDGDGIPNYMDLDADDDGIADGSAGEGATDDADTDGIPDYLDPAVGDDSDDTIAGRGDSDGDGIDDKTECLGGYPCPDLDKDGLMDYMDNDNNVVVPLKVLLAGAYDATTDAMRDGLRILPSFPLTSPYGSGEMINPAILAITDTNNAIVDWVLIELHGTGTLSNTVVISQSALLQRDGDIVSTSDGTSVINISAVGNGDYHIAVHHRNHLSVMTAAPVALSSSSTPIDFTDGSVATAGTNAQIELEPGVYGLWAGDADGNGEIALIADMGAMRNVLLAAPGNTQQLLNYIGVTGVYHAADVNLDGRVLLFGSSSDSSFLKNTILQHPDNGDGQLNFPIR